MSNCTRGISPVIGVIILVSITVTMTGAAAIAVSDYDLGVVSQPPEPDIGFEYSGDTDEVTFWHDGGDQLPADSRIYILVDGDTAFEQTLADPIDATNHEVGTVSVETGDEVRVVWESADGETTATLADITIP